MALGCRVGMVLFLVLRSAPPIALQAARPLSWPYGPAAHDSKLHIETESDANGPFKLNGNYTIMRKTPDEFLIMENGYLLFTSKGDMLAGQGMLFWFLPTGLKATDGAALFVRQSVSKSDLTLANEAVRDHVLPKEDEFAATAIIVVTYYRVTHSQNNVTAPANTLQIVVATDGDRTLVVLNYERLEWTTTLANESPMIGLMDFSNNRRCTQPPKFEANLNLLETMSNVCFPGRWVIRVDRVRCRSNAFLDWDREKSCPSPPTTPVQSVALTSKRNPDEVAPTSAVATQYNITTYATTDDLDLSSPVSVSRGNSTVQSRGVVMAECFGIWRYIIIGLSLFLLSV